MNDVIHSSNLSKEDSTSVIVDTMVSMGIIGPYAGINFGFRKKNSRASYWRKPADIRTARVLVSGGRGLGNSTYFNELQNLSNLIDGAEVSCSRASVVCGWINSERQVGATGNHVSPLLYLAFGISGTDQHNAGIIDAHNVIAINTNPTAPIFLRANLGIVGNLHELVPILTRKILRLRMWYGCE